MPQLFDVKAADYAVPGGVAKAIIFQEKNKAGQIVGQYLMTFALPPGSAGITASGSGYVHEIPITDVQYATMKMVGFFAVEKQVPPDPPIVGAVPAGPREWLQANGFGVASWLTDQQVLDIATRLGYTGK